MIKKNDLCSNCLSRNHKVYDCKNGKCHLCSKSHHVLLHKQQDTPPMSLTTYSNSDTILPTAIVTISTPDNRKHKVRALLDTGSQDNFITQETLKRIGVTPTRTHKSVCTVLGVQELSKGVKKKLKIGNRERPIKCYALTKFNLCSPTKRIEESWPHLEKLQLADPEYKEPRPVRMILGIAVVSQVVRQGLIRRSPTEPIAQKSVFGWVISGKTHTERKESNQGKGESKERIPISCCSIEVNNTVRRKWETRKPLTSHKINSKRKLKLTDTDNVDEQLIPPKSIGGPLGEEGCTTGFIRGSCKPAASSIGTRNVRKRISRNFTASNNEQSDLLIGSRKRSIRDRCIDLERSNTLSRFQEKPLELGRTIRSGKRRVCAERPEFSTTSANGNLSRVLRDYEQVTLKLRSMNQDERERLAFLVNCEVRAGKKRRKSSCYFQNKEYTISSMESRENRKNFPRQRKKFASSYDKNTNRFKEKASAKIVKLPIDSDDNKKQ